MRVSKQRDDLLGHRADRRRARRAVDQRARCSTPGWRCCRSPAGPVLGAFLAGVLTTRIGSRGDAHRHDRRHRRPVWRLVDRRDGVDVVRVHRRVGHVRASRWLRPRCSARCRRMTAFAAAAAIVQRAASPAAPSPRRRSRSARAQRSLWRHAFGTLTYDDEAPPADTRHDLRPRVADQGHRHDDAGDARGGRRPASRLDDPRRATGFRNGAAADRDDVTIRDLLAHAPGLTAYLPFFRDHTGRVEFQPAICALPLEYAPRSQSIYSDLGFMLLGFILEDAQPPAPGFAARPAASIRRAASPPSSIASRRSSPPSR